MTDIEVELKEVTEVYLLGVHLGISAEVLNKIEADYKRTDRRKLKVITYWKRNYLDCSWENLASAVEKMGGHANLVRKLRAKSEGNQEGSGTSTASHIPKQGMYTLSYSLQAQDTNLV